MSSVKWIILMVALIPLFMFLLGIIASIGVEYIIGYGVLTLVFGWIFIAFARIDASASKKLKKAVEHQVMARVLSKAPQVGGDPFTTGTIYFISFEFPDRTRKCFAVDARQNSLIMEGEVGFLTYKQNNEHLFFVNFQPLH